jgi:putative glutathione S-transferase
MGLLVNGKWVDRWYDTEGHKGHFVRSAAQFRNWVTADGSPGPSGPRRNDQPVCRALAHGG